MLLIIVQEYICLCRTGRDKMDYGDVVEVAFSTGPPKLQRFSSAAKLVTISYLVSLLTLCS